MKAGAKSPCVCSATGCRNWKAYPAPSARHRAELARNASGAGMGCDKFPVLSQQLKIESKIFMLATQEERGQTSLNAIEQKQTGPTSTRARSLAMGLSLLRKTGKSISRTEMQQRRRRVAK